MIELYVAHILFCSVLGKCALFADVNGPSMTSQGCQANLDAMYARVLKNPFPVAKKIGTYKVTGLHRGFCLNSNNTYDANWEVRYSL